MTANSRLAPFIAGCVELPARYPQCRCCACAGAPNPCIAPVWIGTASQPPSPPHNSVRFILGFAGSLSLSLGLPHVLSLCCLLLESIELDHLALFRCEVCHSGYRIAATNRHNHRRGDCGRDGAPARWARGCAAGLLGVVVPATLIALLAWLLSVADSQYQEYQDVGGGDQQQQQPWWSYGAVATAILALFFALGAAMAVCCCSRADPDPDNFAVTRRCLLLLLLALGGAAALWTVLALAGVLSWLWALLLFGGSASACDCDPRHGPRCCTLRGHPDAAARNHLVKAASRAVSRVRPRQPSRDLDKRDRVRECDSVQCVRLSTIHAVRDKQDQGTRNRVSAA